MDVLEKLSDAELLDRTEREPEAFAAFYRRHERLVLAFLITRCREPELAADLTAETFATALEAPERFDPERSPGAGAVPWLLTIARSTYLASVRRGVVADEARRRLGLEPLVLDDEALARVETLVTLGPAVEALLESLPSDQREALVARFFDEREYEEIAGQLGCSALVARKRVSRGLSRLRAALTALQP